ncbi:LysR family transcriptional regulator [Marinobacter salarius]|uniref:HTH-type transcriptional regulator PgrR n=1 Tax=Marinobacter salarius TaxID=1420917 RepID=A0A1W6KAH9_9GAMM|nr:LysR family transcriptional regulator [Marinobacter salarius]ARM84309.1 HTH-type transcriptional regulator PgrR [Marinobacter salarius]
MDRIRQVQVFIQVMESGNFTRAAEVLNIPRSTVSTTIQALEDRLGAQLLQRTTRQVAPTHDGLQFLEAAQTLMDAFEAAESIFRQRPQQAEGRLHVDIPSRIGRRIVIPALPEFLKQNPRVKLEFSMNDRIINMLTEGVDCVVRVGHLPDSELVCKKMGEIEVINCASPIYLAQHGTPNSLDDMDGHILVNYAVNLPALAAEWEYVEDGRQRIIKMQSAITVDNAEAYIASAKAGLGIIQVPKFDVQDALESGELIQILDAYKAPSLPISLLYPSRRNLPLRLRVFRSWVTELFSEYGLLEDG